jgi:hypothetical protein
LIQGASMLVDAHNHFSYYQEDIDRALIDIKENSMLMVSVTTESEEIHSQSTQNFKNLISGSPGLDKYTKMLQ